MAISSQLIKMHTTLKGRAASQNQLSEAKQAT